MHDGPAHRPTSWLVTLVTVVPLLLISPAAAAPQGPGARGEVGVIDTLAGPGFCDGAARLDPESVAVRALTVDRSGAVRALAGRPGQDVVARIGGGDPEVNLPVPGITKGADERSSGLMAPAGDGELFVSKGTKIVHLGRALQPDDPAPAATFVAIRAMAADDATNLYVADQIETGKEAVVIRFVNRSNDPVTFYGGTASQVVVAAKTVGTIAGAPGEAGSGDGGPATTATIVGAPMSLATSTGRLYIGAPDSIGRPEGPTGRVRAVNLGATMQSAHGGDLAPGEIKTVAGGGRQAGNGDGEAATSAELGSLPGMVVDGEGNLFLAEESRHRIRKVDRSGVITTVAGTATAGGAGGSDTGGFNGNERPAASALLNRPVDVEIGPNGILYFADKANGMIRSVDRTGIIRVVIGSGLALSSTCDSPLPDAQVTSLVPTNPVADTDGSVYFIASTVGRVMRLDGAGTVTPVTDLRTGCIGTAPCVDPKGRPRVARPSALALGPEKALYILDGGDNRVAVLNLGRRTLRAQGLTVKQGELATVAGNGKIGKGGDGGPATDAQISAARSIALDRAGNLIIADTGNQALRQVDAKGIITPVLAPAARGGGVCCNRVALVATGPGDTLYLTEDRGGIWIQNRGKVEIIAHGQVVPPGMSKLVVGGGANGLEGEGDPAAVSRLQAISGMTHDGKGNLYVAEQPASIRRIDADGILTTAAGPGVSGFNGDGLKARLTSLSQPSSVAIDRCGDLLISDTGNNRIRRLNLVSTCPEPDVEHSADAESRSRWPLVGGILIVTAAAVVSWRRLSART